MISNPHVILVNEQDTEIGIEEKLKAHKLGKLHRAFSIFIFYITPHATELLIQKRHPDKYHSGGLWTNTCCSHPQPGETLMEAAKRRLREEMGIESALIPVGHFRYTTHFANGLIENEFDHVLIGFAAEKNIFFDEDEIQAIEWIELEKLKEELSASPERFTSWFARALHIALTSNELHKMTEKQRT